MSTDELVNILTQAPVFPALARRRPAGGGVPSEPGLYAWWAEADTIGGLPLARVPGTELRLVYVGSAPARPGSQQTLRSRICANDLRGGPAQSPLRRTLCALLWQQQGWELGHQEARIVLSESSQRALAAWQDSELRISWAVTQKPWTERARLGKAMAAPLNLAEDRNHPYHWVISEARQRLRTAALAATC